MVESELVYVNIYIYIYICRSETLGKDRCTASTDNGKDRCTVQYTVQFFIIIGINPE